MSRSDEIPQPCKHSINIVFTCNEPFYFKKNEQKVSQRKGVGTVRYVILFRIYIHCQPTGTHSYIPCG